MVAEARADTSIRTLLVEDDPLQRDALQSGLRRLGLDVTAVADANAGLVAHLRQPFELLVIDMVLPGMDGLKLCAKVRSIRGGDHPYILMITGRGGTRDLTKVLDAGADDFLIKPIDANLLLTRVRIAERHLANSARHRQAREALARSEVDFRRVIERAPLGIIAYCDERIEALIAKKVEGEDITAPVPSARAQVIDLMAALKESLGVADDGTAPAEAPPREDATGVG